MDTTIFPSAVFGTVRAPSSKSQAIRLVTAAMLAGGKSLIRHPSTCDDAMAMRRIAEQLGVEIIEKQDSWMISGGIKFTGGEVNCGESGLAARLMAALAALGSEEIVVTGEGTLMKRHLGITQKPMEAAGVRCRSSEGKLPLRLQGPLAGGRLEIDGSGGSQFVSGLLMALPLAGKDSELLVKNLKSIPYIDMTLEVLEMSGIKISHSNHQNYYIKGNQAYEPFDAAVEGDWSGAAFPLVAAALAGDLTITGLNLNSHQADRKIMEALRSSEVIATEGSDDIVVKKSTIKAFDFDATHCPDLFPPLAVLAAASGGLCRISGVHRLAQKESNRGIVLQKELGKLGIRIDLDRDVMTVHGGEISGGEIFSHHDHRIAMAGAVAGLIAAGPVAIRHAECVSKSWPGFFVDLMKMGVQMTKV